MKRNKNFFSMDVLFPKGRMYSNILTLFLSVFIIYIFSMSAQVIEKKMSKNQGDTIEFSGYHWVTKESFGKHTGPGRNYFSGTKENVWVDSLGKLHLRLTFRNDKWYCPEVRLIDGLGYGRYYFHMDPLPQQLDKDIVIGLFVYDLEDSSNFHKEIDIEFSKWGNDTLMNSQYVVQPKEEEAFRFNTDFNQPTKHMIELRKQKIAFKSIYTALNKDDIPLEITRHKLKPDYHYNTSDERAIINVWLYRTSEPANLKEFEVVISKFEFKKFRWIENVFGRNTNKVRP